MDFTTLTDQQLADTINAGLAEQERRQALATTAAQVEALTTRFTLGGGDVSVITAAVSRGKRPR